MDKLELLKSVTDTLVVTTSESISKSNKFIAEGGNSDVKVGDVVEIPAGSLMYRKDYTIDNVKMTGDVLVGINLTTEKAVEISIGSMNRRYFAEKEQNAGLYPELLASTGFESVKFNKLADGTYELKEGVKLTRNVNVNGFDIEKWKLNATSGKQEPVVKSGKIVTVPKKFTSYNIELL